MQDTFRKRFRSQVLWESNPTSIPWHPYLTGHDSHAIQLHQLGRELLPQMRKFQLKYICK